MKAFRDHTIAGLLALAVLVTVGTVDSYAQHGKFRLGGNNNNSPKFQQNKSLQGIGNRFNNSNTSNPKIGNSGNIQTGNHQSDSKFNMHGRIGQSKWNKGQINDGNKNNNGGLQQILGNRKLQNNNGQAQSQDGKNHNLEGLQNRIQHNNNHNGGQHGNGKLMHLIQQNQKHGKVCVKHDDWCHAKPKACHWWYQYCKPIAYCEPQHHHHCEWNYVTCDYRVGGRVVLADVRWYLGMKGLLLPGQGLGIEEVAPGSPAASVGLQPGMVVTRCNGIDLVDEAALGVAIEQSGGVLQMDLRLSAEGQPATCVVVMQRVASLSY